MYPVGAGSRHHRRPLFPLIFAAIAILAACLVEEAAIRLLDLAKPELFTYSGSRGWKLRPNSSGWQLDEGRSWLRINRWGYRGRDWAPAKPAHTLRIAVIGDSFTEAQQVPEDATFEAVLQKLLMRHRQLFAASRYSWVNNVEVMNFGVDGYRTAQELLTLQEDVWRFSPGIVVLAFFAGNDLRNNSPVLEGDKCRPFYVNRGGHFELGGPFYDSDLFRFQCFARFESYRSELLNSLGSARSVLRRHLREFARRESHSPLKLGPFRRGEHSAHEPGINDLIYRPPVDQVWTDTWNTTEAEIRMIHNDTVRHHARFLLVSIDTGIQVYPNTAAREAYLKSVGGTSLFYPDTRLKALGEREGFPVLALAPAMQAAADAHHLFFHGFANTRMGSGHWNELGHCFAGSLIAHTLIGMLTKNAAASPAALKVPQPLAIPAPGIISPAALQSMLQDCSSR